MHVPRVRSAIALPPSLRVRLLPNLEIAPKVNAAYLEQFPAVAPHETNALAIAYRAFLREAPYQFFINNRTEEARQWMRLLRERYPGDVPADVSLSDAAFAQPDTEPFPPLRLADGNR